MAKYTETIEFAILIDRKPNIELAGSSMELAAQTFGPVGGNFKTMSKQPDLQYIKFVMAAEGTNRNGFILSRDDLTNGFESAQMKPIDVEHSNNIVGHIYDSGLRGKNGKVSTKSNSIDNAALESPLEVIGAGVIYKDQFPETAQKVYQSAITHEYAMSMECSMEDCTYILGNEEIARDNPSFYLYEEAYRTKTPIGGETVKRKPINPRFGGLGIVKVPAEIKAQIAEAAELASVSLDEGPEGDITIYDTPSNMTVPRGTELDKLCGMSAAERIKACKSIGIEVADVIKACKDKEGSKTDKKPYGDVSYADPKHSKYPIDTPEHIRAAWSYIHMSKNQKGYSVPQVKAIKARIASAWKKKIDPKGPPEADKATLEAAEVIEGFEATAANLTQHKEVNEMEIAIATKDQVVDLIKKELAAQAESARLTDLVDENESLKLEVAQAKKQNDEMTAAAEETKKKMADADDKKKKDEDEKKKESDEKSSKIADLEKELEEAKAAIAAATARAEEADKKLSAAELRSKLKGRIDDLSSAEVLFPEDKKDGEEKSARDKQVAAVEAMDDASFDAYKDNLVTVKEMAKKKKEEDDKKKKEEDDKAAATGIPAPVKEKEAASLANFMANTSASVLIGKAKTEGVGFFEKPKDK